VVGDEVPLEASRLPLPRRGRGTGGG